MKPRFDVYSTGYRSKDDKHAIYGAVVIATSPDGREKKIELSRVIGDFTRNQADIISMLMALDSILPEHRDCETVLHTPSNYAGQMVEKNDNGGWLSTPKANIEIVNEVRGIIDSYKSISIILLILIKFKRPIVSSILLLYLFKFKF